MQELAFHRAGRGRRGRDPTSVTALRPWNNWSHPHRSATVKSRESSQVQFLIKWWMQQAPMSQKVHKTVEAPRMWYMNTIVDMLEMKREVPTTQTNRRRTRWKRTVFHSGERRSGCTDQDCLRHGVVVVSRSRCASQQGGRDLGDDPAR